MPYKDKAKNDICKRRWRIRHAEYRREWGLEHPGYAMKWCADHRESVTLSNMRSRCNNPNATDYYLYGGRGIKCLISSVEELITAIGKKPSNKHSIDRIDPNGHYEIGNIRWATAKQQRQNQRSS